MKRKYSFLSMSYCMCLKVSVEESYQHRDGEGSIASSQIRTIDIYMIRDLTQILQLLQLNSLINTNIQIDYVSPVGYCTKNPQKPAPQP
jgi:hypothetical protein